MLNKVAGLLPKVTGISIQEGTQTFAKEGEIFVLHPEVKLRNATGSISETEVSWSIEPETNAFLNGTFTPTAEMVGQTYKVTVTSKFDNSFSASSNIYVYPSDAEDVVMGETARPPELLSIKTAF